MPNGRGSSARRRRAAAGAAVVPNFLEIGRAMKAALANRRRSHPSFRTRTADAVAAVRRSV